MFIRKFSLVGFLFATMCWSQTSLAQGGTWSTPARMTHVGPNLDSRYDARESNIAFNSTNNEYLIVWEGTDMRPGVALGEAEIYAQRVNADTGALLGTTALRVSFMGPQNDPVYDARNPAVVYNPTANEYLVVWYGDDNRGTLVEGEFEIFGQRINAATGALVGTQNFRISDMGPNGNRNYDALDPAVSYDKKNDLYLVAWRGEDGAASTPAGEFEIYGQLLDGATGGEVGSNDFPITSMGPPGDPNYGAFSPELAYNATANEFLVVWYGDDNTAPLVNDEFEVFARRLDANTGLGRGSSQIRVSDAGNNGDILREARRPEVTWNRDSNEYLVVWKADDTTGGRLNDEFEIYGQLLSASGTEIGSNDFLISNMGGAGESLFDAFEPEVAYHGAAHQYVVTWRGDDKVDGEFEIYAQRLDSATMAPVGISGQRLTHAGPDGTALYDARRVAMTEDVKGGRIFIVWEEEDETATQTLGEFEAYASSLDASTFKVFSGMTGSWFDQTHNGEGWVVEVINATTAVVYWFTYDTDRPVQAWVLGVGKIIDNRIVVTDARIPSGGMFGPGFDPNTVKRDPWGSFVLEYDDCSNARVNYNSTRGNFGADSLLPTRLTALQGLECPGPGTVPDTAANFSGSWYDPSHNGEGWVLEYVGSNRLAMYWFTYDDVGNQAWFFGVGTVAGSTVTFDNVLISSGTVFGKNFDPKAAKFIPWGTLALTLNGCNGMTVDYASSDPKFGVGQLNAVRLISLQDLACQ